MPAPKQRSIAKFVRQGIDRLFLEVAEMVAQGEIGAGFTEDEMAGVPMAIFTAQTHILNCWDDYLDREPADGEVKEWPASGC